MSDDLSDVVRHERIQNVKEVLAWWAFAFRIDRGEVLEEVAVLLHIRPQCRDRHLVVVGDRNLGDLILLEELFITGEDLLEEVLVDYIVRRQIVLYCRGIRQIIERHLQCWSK